MSFFRPVFVLHALCKNFLLKPSPPSKLIFLILCRRGHFSRVKGKPWLNMIFITIANCVCGGYAVFMLSVRNVLFPKYLEKSLLEFHQTLQTYIYKTNTFGWGLILLKLFPFVIPNDFFIKNPCKTLGLKKNMVYEIRNFPGG